MPRFSTIQKRMIMRRMKNLSKEQRKMMMSIIKKKGSGLQLAGQRRRPKQRGGRRGRRRKRRVRQRVRKRVRQRGGRHREGGVLNPSGSGIHGSGIRLAGKGLFLAGRGIPKKALSFIKRFPKQAKKIFQHIKKGDSKKVNKIIGGLVGIAAIAGGIALKQYLLKNPGQILDKIPAEVFSLAPIKKFAPVIAEVFSKDVPDPGTIIKTLGGSGLRLSGQMGRGHSGMISCDLVRPRMNMCRRNIMVL